MGTMMDVLATAGCLSVFTTPALLVVIVGQSTTMRRLEARNGAQGQTIAGLQARLERSGRADMPKSCQIGTAGREVVSEVGASTSNHTVGAVRADFERDCG